MTTDDDTAVVEIVFTTAVFTTAVLTVAPHHERHYLTSLYDGRPSYSGRSFQQPFFLAAALYRRPSSAIAALATALLQWPSL